MICLDTNTVIEALNRRLPHVRARLEEALAIETAVGVSAIVLFELRYGVAKSAQRAANAAAIETFLTLAITILPFDAHDAEEAAEIRGALERIGKPIGPYDVLIAAQARRRSAALITANTSEFSRVPGLSIEDWTRA